jgi:hypothetical protein
MKQQFLDEIKRIAKKHGRVPGVILFEKENKYEYKQKHWYGIYWDRWSDAQKEAGFEPNPFGVSIPEDELIEKYIALIQKLGHFPIRVEIRREKRSNPDFPSTTTFEKSLGKKKEIAERILEYCRQHDGFEDVISLCRDIVGTRGDTKIEDDQVVKGYVYLLKLGRRHYKIGKTKSLARREYELRIGLPEKPRMVHRIATDDPSGIETYWHKRFRKKRGESEWFELDENDIRAFKSRREYM